MVAKLPAMLPALAYSRESAGSATVPLHADALTGSTRFSPGAG